MKQPIIITKMNLSIWSHITEMCFSSYCCIWPSFSNFGLCSRWCLTSFVPRVIEDFCSRGWISASSDSLVSSTHFDFYLNLEIHVLIAFHPEPLQMKTFVRHTSYWWRYCVLSEWFSKNDRFCLVSSSSLRSLLIPFPNLPYQTAVSL